MSINIAIYGKLPAHSDYVLLNFPAGVETALHQWSVQVLSATERVLGREQWLQAFLNANPCGCILQTKCPDLASFYGVMVPSVDRVGRYFPLFSGLFIEGQVDPTRLDQPLLDLALQAILDEQVKALHGRKQVDLLYAALLARPGVTDLATALEPLASLPVSKFDKPSNMDAILHSWWWEIDRPDQLCETAGMPPVDYYQSILTRGPVRHE
ncbi:type VI secretion system-associated protein TagF [Nitrincola iocasae]|uniref:Type VI secretion system-associated protein TagF n=1 Tax=Nitrincola iocasae TaxID=2614693 RepID=A0A5J6LAN8_9GAMM|nr:type VI secretion system-associated protein TagF [Nitrincola iocasae]QEW05704.1 type VI secretion system-associated protein TagF [Nitrincola iocasae]